ncbi:MAG: hypothetical protein ACM3YF_05815 [Candidatus Zixiibacteriota bacterium]
MKWELKRIDLASLAKVALFLNAILGFLIGIPIGFFIYLGSLLPGLEENPIPQGLAFIFPFITMFIYGIINTLVALLAGLFYNLVGHLFGGIEIELKEVRPAAAPTPAAPGAVDLSSL